MISRPTRDVDTRLPTFAAVPDSSAAVAINSPLLQQALNLLMSVQSRAAVVPVVPTMEGGVAPRRWEQSDRGALALAREYFAELGYSDRDISGNMLGGPPGPVPTSDRGAPPRYGGPGVGYPRGERPDDGRDSRESRRRQSPSYEGGQVRLRRQPSLDRRPPRGGNRADDF